MEKINKAQEIKNVCLWGESPVVNHVFANHRNSVNFSINSMFTLDGMCNIMGASGGEVLLGRQLRGTNNEHNRYITKAFEPLLEKSYGPVFPRSWQGRQNLTGGLV